MSQTVLPFNPSLKNLQRHSEHVSEIAVHVGCHVQRLKHRFPFFVEVKHTDPSIVHIDCPESEIAKSFTSVTLLNSVNKANRAETLPVVKT